MEIYFILYLAALIFLIPKPNDKKTHSDSNIQELPFSIRPEKSVLFCRMMLDSGSAKIIHLDSINTIFHTGDTEDLEYDFVIEDQVFKQKLRLSASANYSNRYFNVSTDKLQNIAFFRWVPPAEEKMNKSYIVYVSAKGKAKNSDVPVIARTQFTLVMNYFDAATGMPIPPVNSSPTADNPIGALTETAPNLGDISLSLRYDFVQSIAYQEWDNDIFILGGLNPINDLLKNPDIEIIRQPDNNGGSAYISKYFSNGISIKGKAPGFGSMKVRITIKRRFDSREATISFNVVPQAIGNPEFPQNAFPGLTYQIKPNLPSIAGQEIKAILKEDDRIRAQSYQGDAFSFTPTASDIGKTFYLERYVNGNLVGQRHRINVKNFPAPELVKFSKIGDASVLVQTNSFGYKDSKENVVVKLDIYGNAVYKERFGQYKADKSNHTWTQFFEINPKDPNKPFTFKIKLSDRRGENSEYYEYNAE